MSYSNEEYFNMLMCLGRCNCNYAKARREYQEIYAVPRNLALPSAMAFRRLHMRVSSTGSVHGRDSHRADAGRPRLRDDDIEEEEDLEMFGEDPTGNANDEDDDDDVGVYYLKAEEDRTDADFIEEENGETHDNYHDAAKENDKGSMKVAPLKKPKREDTEEEEEDGEHGKEEEDEEDEEEEEKKPIVNAVFKKEKFSDEEAGDEEDKEVQEEAPKPKVKKEPTEPPVPLPAGRGIPLGHISTVEVSLSRFKTQDQKLLHQYLYGQLCLDRNVKRNIKKFKGYEWAIGSSEYKAKLEETTKMEPKQLRTICEMLDLDKKGSSSELASRLVGFLQQPVANSPHARGVARAPPSAPATGGRPRRSAAVKMHNRGYSDEEYKSDPETIVEGWAFKPLKDGSEDSVGSFNLSCSEADSDFNPEGGEGASGAGRKRRAVVHRRSAGKGAKRGKRAKGKRAKSASKGVWCGGKKIKSESEDESDKFEIEGGGEDGSGSEGEESDEQKSKPASVKATPVKQEPPTPVKREPLTPIKQEPLTPVKREPPTPPGKKKAAAKAADPLATKGGKASSEEESGEGNEEDEEGKEEEDESGEKSDTLVDKKTKRPPTDDEIKKYVKQILAGANLEHITMKSVCKQVYNHFPDFDLEHKKDLIKVTVKSCI